MQTRRDQLHAYRFMTRRAMSALITGEPDTVEPPMRRLVVMTLSGVMIAILVAAVFAVIGLLRPGAGKDWQEEGTVVAERETGARYVYLGGRLHPVLNYPTAVLASGATSEVEVQIVNRDELAEAEPGPALGILGLPDSLPEPDALVDDQPVVVCSSPTGQGAAVSTEVRLSIGGEVPPPLAQDEAVLVESIPGGGEKADRYLVWRGQRHLIDPRVASRLSFTARRVKVGRALLTALPEGKPFTTPDIDGLGERRSFGGRTLRVGQLVQVEGDPEGTFRVLLDDGLTPVTQIQQQLLRTVRIGGRPLEPATLRAADVPVEGSTAGADDLARQTEGLPEDVPAFSDAAVDAGGLCALYRGGEATPTLAAPPRTASSQSIPVEDGVRSRQAEADVVEVRPGTGMLAQGPQGEAVSLVVPPGRRFQAATLGTLGGFGYGDLTPVQLPAELLAIIPEGPALDPDAALVPVPADAADAASS